MKGFQAAVINSMVSTLWDKLIGTMEHLRKWSTIAKHQPFHKKLPNALETGFRSLARQDIYENNVNITITCSMNV